MADRVTGEIAVVSHSTASPAQTADGFSGAHVISADGNWIAFLSDATDLVPMQHNLGAGVDVFLFERATGTVTLVSHDALSPVRTVGRWLMHVP